MMFHVNKTEIVKVEEQTEDFSVTKMEAFYWNKYT